MPQVHDVQSLNHLDDIQRNHPASLIVVYFQSSGVLTENFNTYRVFAQQASHLGSRSIIFGQHSIGGNDATLQQAYRISNTPCVLMFQGSTVVRRLEDVSSRMLEKYTTRHANTAGS